MIQLLLVTFLFNGLTGKILGSVQNEDTGEPVPFVSVRILNTELGTAADEAGSFYFLNVHPGIYALEISSIGYQIKTVENIIVEIDQTYRLKITLKPATIDLAPIIVVGETPTIKKDMVATTYYIRKQEIRNLPFDYIANIISFQPSVANVDTALHVRGGRATEVLYMIDNVSIIDPQTGDPAINISKGVIDEVIFLPGGFDAEYGRAMSGVVNLITEHPKDKLNGRLFGKTETMMPSYYNFGYQDYNASLHLPMTRRIKGLFTADLTHTDDWDPRLLILPHKQRDDYALYGKIFYSLATNLNVSLTTTLSRTQLDRYHHKFKFNLNHFRSDWRKSDLEIINLNYLPVRNWLINATLSRLSSRFVYGVRDSVAFGPFDDFTFRDYNTMRRDQPGFMNPFGVYIRYFRIEGDYWEYQNKASLVMNAKINSQYQLNKNDEIKCGIDYSYLDLKSFSHYSGDSTNPIDDEYGHKPLEVSGYIQNTIDYQGLFMKTGCRIDNYYVGIDSIPSATFISPRIGLSFLITSKVLFRMNIGKYIQPPNYDQCYIHYSLLPLNTSMPIILVGNPRLKPEKTNAYEIGFQGEINKTVSCNFNVFYKDVTNLLGTRHISALPKDYVSYTNTEYALIRGLEIVTDIKSLIFSGKISYTLSWAKGTSSFAEEIFYRYYLENPDTNFIPPTSDYYLDFDQRHRLFFQGEFNLPGKVKFYVFNFLGNGFPYTPPGEEGKTETRNNLRFTPREQLDCLINKDLRIGNLSITGSMEITNVFNNRYQISTHQTWIPLSNIRHSDFHDYYPFTAPYYHPAADLNHDGVITPTEEFTAYRALVIETDDWIGSISAPRRIRIGVSLSWN